MKHVLIIIALAGVLFLSGLPAWTQSNAGSEADTSAQSAAEGQSAEQSTDAQTAETTDTGTSQPSAVNEEELAIRDTESPQVELEGGLTTFTVWDFLRMVLVLGGVIAAIYGIFFLLKRVGNPRTQPDSLINVLSTQNLQGNRSLHLIEVGNEVFLVGSADGGVQLISRIEEGETLDAIHLYRSQLSAGTTTFQNTLKGFFSKSGNVDTQGNSTQGFGSQGQGSQEKESANAASASATSGDDVRNTGSSSSKDRASGGMSENTLFLQRQRERLKNM